MLISRVEWYYRLNIVPISHSRIFCQIFFIAISKMTFGRLLTLKYNSLNGFFAFGIHNVRLCFKLENSDFQRPALMQVKYLKLNLNPNSDWPCFTFQFDFSPHDTVGCRLAVTRLASITTKYLKWDRNPTSDQLVVLTLLSFSTFLFMTSLVSFYHYISYDGVYEISKMRSQPNFWPSGWVDLVAPISPEIRSGLSCSISL